MSERIPGNAEITPAEQQRFIDMIDGLQPLLGQPYIIADEHDEFVDENIVIPSSTTTSFSWDGKFTVGGRDVGVSIDEIATVSDESKDYMKTWTAKIVEPLEQHGGRQMRVIKSYEVQRGNNHHGLLYSEEYFAESEESGKWELMKTPTQEASTKLAEAMASDDEDAKEEAFSMIRESHASQKALEDITGESDTRFTRQRFEEIMSVLESIEL